MITRAQLYELVWNKPSVRVAKSLAVSGPGLKRICERYRIDTPPRGYWARRRVGQKVEQPILGGDPKQLIRAHFRIKDERGPQRSAASDSWDDAAGNDRGNTAVSDRTPPGHR